MAYKVAIIGHTGRGNYGHYVDEAFVGVEGAEIVALADPDDTGRQQAIERTGAAKGYADYREMLAEERPDITVIATREIGDHYELAMAAAAADTHIYIEKPIAASPAQVDEMMAVCERNDKLLIVACPGAAILPSKVWPYPSSRAGRSANPASPASTA